MYTTNRRVSLTYVIIEKLKNIHQGKTGELIYIHLRIHRLFSKQEKLMNKFLGN